MASSHAMRLVVFMLLVTGLFAQQLDNGDEGAGAVSGDTDAGFRRNKLIMNKKDVFPKRAIFEKDEAGNEVAIASSGEGFTDATFSSLSMILVSEIGDETFIIAALMAMRHPRSIVLSGALSALIIMTVLSTGLGVIVPNLISQKLINKLATGLYTFFGLRLLYIAWKSDAHSTPQKELEEVEEKLEGGVQKKNIVRRIFSRFCTPIFLEAMFTIPMNLAALVQHCEWRLSPEEIDSMNKNIEDVVYLTTHKLSALTCVATPRVSNRLP